MKHIQTEEFAEYSRIIVIDDPELEAEYNEVMVNHYEKDPTNPKYEKAAKAYHNKLRKIYGIDKMISVGHLKGSGRFALVVAKDLDADDETIYDPPIESDEE